MKKIILLFVLVNFFSANIAFATASPASPTKPKTTLHAKHKIVKHEPKKNHMQAKKLANVKKVTPAAKNKDKAMPVEAKKPTTAENKVTPADINKPNASAEKGFFQRMWDRIFVR